MKKILEIEYLISIEGGFAIRTNQLNSRDNDVKDRNLWRSSVKVVVVD